MSTRIIFNGQEYASPDDMPEDVRKAYQAVLDSLADQDGDGLPDAFTKDGRNVVAVHQSSITFKGPFGSTTGGLPGPLGRLVEAATGRLGAQSGDRDAGERDVRATARGDIGRTMEALDSATSAAGSVLLIIAGLVAGAVTVGAIWLILNMDEGSRAQGGAFYIGAVAVLIVGWAIAMIVRLYRR